jgi:hypothetical protein
VGIAGCFGVPFSITGSGGGLESMAAQECQLLAARADPLKVRLEAEEILSGFNEASITWPPNPLPPSTSSASASHTRVCFTNRILYRTGGSSTITCNGYSSPASKMSHSSASRPVVTLPHYSRHRELCLFNTLILFVLFQSSHPLLQICSFVVNSPPPPTTVRSSQDAVHRSPP